MKKRALWFSRHAPTAAQVAGIAAMGYEIAALDDGIRLGAMNLADDGDLKAVLSALLGLAAQHEAEVCFGVFAAPVQECLHRTANDAVQAGDWGSALTCYAAWNVMRSADGGKPTFEHRRFCCVGALSGAALRWACSSTVRAGDSQSLGCRFYSRRAHHIDTGQYCVKGKGMIMKTYNNYVEELLAGNNPIEIVSGEGELGTITPRVRLCEAKACTRLLCVLIRRKENE